MVPLEFGLLGPEGVGQSDRPHGFHFFRGDPDGVV